jgi:hypothetical protein
MKHREKRKCRNASCGAVRETTKFSHCNLICDSCYTANTGRCAKCNGIKCKCIAITSQKKRQQHEHQMVNTFSKQSTWDKRNYFIRRFSLFQSNGRQYIVLKHMFSPQQCAEIKKAKEDEAFEDQIQFDNGYNRLQKSIGKLHPPTNRKQTGEQQHIHRDLKLMFNLLHRIHPTIAQAEYKLLKSIPYCPTQQLHFDDPKLPYRKYRLPSFDWCSISCLVSLEPNDNPTRILFDTSRTGSKTKTLTLPQGSMVIWRGDTFHAGAEYVQENVRLFIGIGTDKFRNDGERVGILSLDNWYSHNIAKH